MGYEAVTVITVPDAQLPYEQRHISEFKGFDWSKGTKADAVSFARASGFKETGMSVNEVALMYDLLEAKKPRTIVELGRNYGCSTRLFTQNVERNGGTIESWDLKHWPGFLEIMAENGYESSPIANYPGDFFLHKKAHIRVAHSIKTPVGHDIEQYGVDFLLIDTEHGIENLLPEYCRWREYLNAGAMIAFHDSTLPKVHRGIEMCVEMEQTDRPGRIKCLHELERHDGFGITVMEWS